MSITKIRQKLTELTSEREKVIKKMKELRDDIQEEDRRHHIGKIAYSSTGVIAGGLTIAGIALAPFTFGASLGLTIAGAATGAASGIAGISHGIAAHVIIKNKSKEAEELLKEHKSEMDNIRELVREFIEDGSFAVGTTVKGGGVISNITSTVMKSTTLASRGADTAESVASTVAATSSKAFTVAGGVMAGIAILIDIGTIFNSSSKIANNTLHDKVKELDKVIEELEDGLEFIERLRKLFRC